MAQTKRLTIIAFGLSVVFGLGWGLGLAATSSDAKEVTFVFQVIFSIFVSAQGILIFILHGLRSPDARLVWKTWLSCLTCIGTGKNYNPIYSTSKRGDGSTLKTAQSSKYQLSTLKPVPQSISEVPKLTPSIPEASIEDVEEGRAEKVDLAKVGPIAQATKNVTAVSVTLTEATEAKIKKKEGANSEYDEKAKTEYPHKVEKIPEEGFPGKEKEHKETLPDKSSENKHEEKREMEKPQGPNEETTV